MRLTSHRILPVALILTLAACMAPGRALGVPNLLAEIVALTFTPFTALGGIIAAALRPPIERLEGTPGDREFLLHLQSERDEFERLFIAEQARVEALQQQIDQLQQVQSDQSRVPIRPVIARVALRSSVPFGTVTINRGSAHGIEEGTVAVYNQVHLLGKVVSVSRLQSTLLPLANPSTGLIDAVIRPRDRRDLPLDKAPRIQLQAEGDGTLHGDLDRSVLVNVGDQVHLIDENWRPSAQAMTLGFVERIEPRDDQPLRHRVVIRPQYHVSNVAYLTLKVEGEPGAAPMETAGAAGGSQP